MEKLNSGYVHELIDRVSLFELLRRVTKSRLKYETGKDKIKIESLYDTSKPASYLFRNNSRERYAFEAWSDFNSVVVCKVFFVDQEGVEHEGVGFSKANLNYDEFNIDVGTLIAIRRSLESLLDNYCQYKDPFALNWQ